MRAIGEAYFVPRGTHVDAIAATAWGRSSAPAAAQLSALPELHDFM